MPTLDPNQDHNISLKDAKDLVARFRASTFNQGTKGAFFGKNAIDNILKQTDCVGLRYYYGLDASNKPVLVLVGVTANNEDIADGLLAELSIPCPNVCDATSPFYNL